jgi:hypothetical protein
MNGPKPTLVSTAANGGLELILLKNSAILGVVEYPKSMLTFRRKLIHVLT